MFVSKGQFYVFFACIAFGAIASILLLISSVIKSKLKYKSLKILLDVFAFLIITVLYVFYSYLLAFPSLRLYMPLGVFLGLFLAIKSYHITLAKFVKKIYNIIKEKRVKSKDERSKS